ncbi:ZIP family metal transporter [Thermobrachium celere]|uniref:Zinc transporter, ZIP family n=1 Tax=Thermobrachium celere DSM 8682 TaxID=941824 RepID=R7RPL1_9CLOT|nr:ZIP family metal transporter [Thermobrachium celere]CDF57311.1 Zinc transporter, ZIP family [Thermobrachium celere DSM 8682]
MDSRLHITLFATLCCMFGTSFGGLLTVLFRKTNNIIMSAIMGIAGGLMLSVVTFDLIPEAIQMAGFNVVLLGIILGVLFISILDMLLPYSKFIKRYGKGIKIALLLALGLAAHNFPEGLAIGSGFRGSKSLGYEIAFVIAMHDIPEGAAVAAPLLNSSLSKFKIILFTALTAIPTALGAYIGAYIGEIEKNFIALSLGFASGTMLYIVVGELIPESKENYRGILSTLSIIIGFIIGFILITII